MEAYIPFPFPSTKTSKPWFNSACSRAIRRRNVAFRDYHRLQTPETHATYISSRNRAKSILRNTTNSFLRRKCNNLPGSFSSRSFWHFQIMSTLNLLLPISPPLISSNSTTAVLPSKAELFARTFASNSTLDDSGAIPPPIPSNSTSTHSALLEKVESRAFRFINSPALTNSPIYLLPSNCCVTLSILSLLQQTLLF
ncbi:UNVERIFIED_CONTAM: hypothetical protein RMT77_011525 [Armadillidium vulgare]